MHSYVFCLFCTPLMKPCLSRGTVNHAFTVCHDKQVLLFSSISHKKRKLKSTIEKKRVLYLNNQTKHKKIPLSISRSVELTAENLGLKVDFQFKPLVHQFLKVVILYRSQGLPSSFVLFCFFICLTLKLVFETFFHLLLVYYQNAGLQTEQGKRKHQQFIQRCKTREVQIYGQHELQNNPTAHCSVSKKCEGNVSLRKLELSVSQISSPEYVAKH